MKNTIFFFALFLICIVACQKEKEATVISSPDGNNNSPSKNVLPIESNSITSDGSHPTNDLSSREGSYVFPESDKIGDFLGSWAFGNFLNGGDFGYSPDSIYKEEVDGVDKYFLEFSMSESDENRHMVVTSDAESNIYLAMYFVVKVDGEWIDINISSLNRMVTYLDFVGDEEEWETIWGECEGTCAYCTDNFTDCMNCAFQEIFSDWISTVACSIFGWLSLGSCTAAALGHCLFMPYNPTGGGVQILADLSAIYVYVDYYSQSDIIVVN